MEAIEIAFETWTKEELFAFAEQNGLANVKRRMTKREMIARIRNVVSYFINDDDGAHQALADTTTPRW